MVEKIEEVGKGKGKVRVFSFENLFTIFNVNHKNATLFYYCFALPNIFIENNESSKKLFPLFLVQIFENRKQSETKSRVIKNKNRKQCLQTRQALSGNPLGNSSIQINQSQVHIMSSQ